MSITIHSADERNTINWAGGTSTEMFIYPPDGSFADRDFTFRISSATVEIEESTFTFFEGITRHLMILDGTLELTHTDRYTKTLNVYDQDTFSGEWPTTAKGKVTDFNLMLKNGAEGTLKHVELDEGGKKVFTKRSDYYFVYIAKGLCTVDGTSLFTGDLVEIEKGEVKFLGIEDCDLIEIRVNVPS
jgi:environmental stress-induced protein Ves